MNARCCGIAGTYGLKAEKYDDRDGRRRRPLRRRCAARARRRSRCDSETCRWQIAHGTERAVGAPDRPPAPRLRTLASCAWSGSSSSPTARRSPRASSSWRARWAARSSRSRRPAGSTSPGALGTDAERVRAAIERAMSDDGVLVLMDLGSALMSAEIAIEMLERRRGRVLLSEAPLVEGAVAAAVAARRRRVARRGGRRGARRAGDEGVAARRRGRRRRGARGGRRSRRGRRADAEARLEVRNAIGLHARPAARFVETGARLRRRGRAWPRTAAARPVARDAA